MEAVEEEKSIRKHLTFTFQGSGTTPEKELSEIFYRQDC